MDDAELVQRFLRLMEARDLDGAGALLAPEFEMVFPGGRRMRTLAELVAWSRTRYSGVVKKFERIDAVDGAAGGATGAAVYVSGVLTGVWPDGSGFEGVRYIDRFEVAGGLIRRQEVWNDLGEVLLARRAEGRPDAGRPDEGR